MKTILALTDYSKVSLNAVRYAADLAMSAKAKLVLLHVYNLPLPTADAPLMAIAPEVLEKDNRKRIEQLQYDIIEKVKGVIPIESVVHSGFCTEQILRTAKEKKADLIVIGTTGEGEIMQAFVGSTTSSVMKKSQVPVLVIPEKATFGQAEKIVYACDFEKLNDHTTLEVLKEMAQLLHSEIMVLNANNKIMVPPVDGATEGIELERLLGNVKHSYWYSEETDIIDAVNEFVEKHDAKIVAMFARKHLFPENMVHRSVTKRMALNTQVPFLSIHE
jgi:nucleotide-binding universal stress UspA family protein